MQGKWVSVALTCSLTVSLLEVKMLFLNLIFSEKYICLINEQLTKLFFNHEEPGKLQ